jgi:hypothetical protein
MPRRSDTGTARHEPAPGAGPDAGLAAIAAGFTATAGVATARPPAAGQHADHPEHAPARRGEVTPWDVWPLRLPPVSATAATNFDPVDWGPPTGRAWRLSEVIITLNGASLVSFYKEAIQPVNLRFQTSVSGVWEPRAMYLLPGERLIAAFTGGGAIVAVEGEQIALDFLPRYLA